MEISPGDQVLLKIPAEPGETPQVWAYVLKGKPEDGKISIVVDAPLVVSQDRTYSPQSCVNVDRDQVIAHIPADPNRPMLHFAITEGTFLDVRRVDGSKTPIMVSIDEGGQQRIYRIDHRRSEPMPDSTK